MAWWQSCVPIARKDIRPSFIAEFDVESAELVRNDITYSFRCATISEMESPTASSEGHRNSVGGARTAQRSSDPQLDSPAGSEMENQQPAPNQGGELVQGNANPPRTKPHGRWRSLWFAKDSVIALASLILAIVALWIAVSAIKYSVWTAKKDYLEYCQDQVCA